MNLDPDSRPKVLHRHNVFWSILQARSEIHSLLLNIDHRLEISLTALQSGDFAAVHILHGPIAECRSQCSISQLRDSMIHEGVRTNKRGVAANTCQRWLCLPCLVLRAYWPYFKDKINMCAVVARCFSRCLFNHLISKIIQLNHPKRDSVSSKRIKLAVLWTN